MTVEAGWYDDGRGSMRYWDGTMWSETVIPGPAVPPTGFVDPYSPGGRDIDLMPPPMAVMPAYPQHTQQPYPMYGAPQPMYGAVAPYGRPVLQGNPAGVTGFVVGLVSVFLPIIFGLVVAIVGLTFSIIGMTRVNATKGLAIAGLVLSILGIIFIL